MQKKVGFLINAKRFLEPVESNKGFFVKAILRTILNSSVGIAHVLVIQHVTKQIELGNKEGLPVILLGYSVGIVIYFILSYISRNVNRVDLYFNLTKTLNKMSFRQYIKLDTNYVETLGTGKLINIIGTGVRFRVEMLIDFANVLFGSLINIMFAFYMVSRIGGVYVVAFIGIFMILLGLVYFVNKRGIPWRKKRKETEIDLSRQSVKMIMMKNEILQNDSIEKEIETLDFHADKGSVFNDRLMFYMWWLYNMPMMLVYGLSVFVLFYLGISVSDGSFSYSALVGIVAVIGSLEGTMMYFVDSYKRFTDNFSQVEKLWATIDDAPKMKGYDKGKNFNYKRGDISIKKLGFKYTDGSEVFKDFSVNIQGSKKTAFVGESGSGKTTLIKLIAGYLHFQEGCIAIDGQNLAGGKKSVLPCLSLRSYYKHVGYLTQEPNVFDGTILDNLVYSLDKDSIDDKDFDNHLKEIIKLAKCEFIFDLKYGLDTEIGERGVRLSGGQKQRLAIAKIMLKNPNIILLDEPTSALDSISEELISQALHNLFKGKTVIIIAHRLQTVKEADEIFVFDKGNIIESGDHQSLIKTNGYYKKMLDLQSGF